MEETEYVDDFIGVKKLHVNDGFKILSTAKMRNEIHALQSQRFFDTVKRNALVIGMTVNDSTTQLLCLAPATSQDSTCSYILTDEGNRIESGNCLKQLGFNFGEHPNLDAQVEHMRKKFRGRLWLLRHLQRAQVPKDDLLALYKSLLLSVLDYASVVYHLLLTKTQTNMLERLQAAAMKIIFARKRSYAKIMEDLDGKLDYLQVRRRKMTDKFITEAAANPTYREKWFLRREFFDQNLRRSLYYKEEYARTSRLYDSPLFYYRRRLNELTIPTK